MTQTIKRTWIYSDLFNAQIFYDLYKNKVAWCPQLGGWFIFNGRNWELDKSSGIDRLSVDAFHELSERMKKIDDQPALNHAKKSASNAALKAMVERSKSFLGNNSDNFDAKSEYFNCLNGTFDFKKMKLMPHNSGDYLIKIANVTYDESAKCPIWEKFIDDICLSRKDLKKFLQKIIGYSMTDNIEQQCMFFLYGSGRNGKSKFVETIAHIMGDYSMNCPSDTFIENKNSQNTNGIARLKGSRFVTAIETNQNVTIDEKTIKNLTGDRTVTARFLNKEFFEFTPTFKIFLATNNKPNIRGTDIGIWRRVRMIPFDMRITDANDDKELGGKLLAEASGILNWMIEGYRLYKEEGLAACAEVNEATKLYQESEDDLGQFLDDECVVDKEGIITSKEFKDRFKSVMGYYKSQKIVSQYMERNGFKENSDGRLMVNGRQVRGFKGIRWATELDRVKDEGWTE